MVGTQCLLARVQQSSPGALPALVHADAGGPEKLRQWQRQNWFKGAAPVLVLPAAERQFLTLDQPDLPPAELAMAVRYPLCEALDAEPDDLLTTAVPMPRINDAQRTQMLAVAARLKTVKEHLARLSSAGIAVKGIDTCDTALRGMALLDGEGEGGTIVLTYTGEDINIGLLWQGRFCALRSLPLPQPAAAEDPEFEERLALQIQRTVDYFERHATQLAVRRVLGSMPTLGEGMLKSVLAALPLPARAFDLDMALAPSAAARQACERTPELVALACIAAARWLDQHESTGQAASAPQDQAADERNGRAATENASAPNTGSGSAVEPAVSNVYTDPTAGDSPTPGSERGSVFEMRT